MISVWSFTETEYRLDVEGSIELVWKSLCGESSPMVSSPVMELQNPCHGGVISQSNNEGKVHCKDNKSMSFFIRMIIAINIHIYPYSSFLSHCVDIWGLGLSRLSSATFQQLLAFGAT